MGTSTRNRGQSGHNPLIPTWLDGDPLPASEPVAPQESGTLFQQPIPQDADPNRFRGPRTAFAHFASGGGRNNSSLKRGIAHYVSRSLGGSRNATKRLGSSRTSTARLFGVLRTLSETGGLQQVARLLSLKRSKVFLLLTFSFILQSLSALMVVQKTKEYPGRPIMIRLLII